MNVVIRSPRRIRPLEPGRWGSALGGWVTMTGQCACRVQFSLVEPSSRLVTGFRPRAPTTSKSACALRRTSTSDA